jgi:hypothetical protein
VDSELSANADLRSKCATSSTVMTDASTYLSLSSSHNYDLQKRLGLDRHGIVKRDARIIHSSTTIWEIVGGPRGGPNEPVVHAGDKRAFAPRFRNLNGPEIA